MPRDRDDDTGDDGTAPAADAVLAQLGGGANQTGARAYNDRLILSLLRRAGPLSKAELSRRTGLSAQTLTVLVKRLEAGHLLKREEPLRGRIGQPSVPWSLNPDAVFSYGLKIGRRSVELALCDFTGAMRGRRTRDYPYPTPDLAMDFLRESAGELRDGLRPALRARVIGAGVAMPFEIWNWAERVDAPPGALEAWRGFDVEQAARAVLGMPVIVCNDATAACAAEGFAANGAHHLDFLYIFVGWFIGGGVTLGGTLFSGRAGNAGAIGSAPVTGPEGKPVPLMHIASLATLEDALRAEGRDPALIRAAAGDWSEAGPALDRWIDAAARGIAQAAVGAAALLDLGALYIDGAMPADVRDRLTNAIADAIRPLDTRGIAPITVMRGRSEADARLEGAAYLPIIAGFTKNQSVLVKHVEG